MTNEMTEVFKMLGSIYRELPLEKAQELEFVIDVLEDARFNYGYDSGYNQGFEDGFYQGLEVE